jgi:hypothetical protein
MATATVQPIPLACVPEAIPAADRQAHFRLVRDLFGSHCEARDDVEHGYVFRFPSSSFEHLTRFVVNERKCCPFLRIELRSDPGEGPVWLRLTGPEGTHDLLTAELELAVCGCR